MNYLNDAYFSKPAHHYFLLLVVTLSAPQTCLADGQVIDKIYHPYVQPLEQEIEWRMLYQDDPPQKNTQSHRLAYGRSLNDQWFAEIYLIGEKTNNEGFEIEAYEVEAKWQLTEQGEYSADYALLFEFEKEKSKDSWEAATALLVEKEWGRWSGTSNFILSHEWGDDIKDEFETSLNIQARYRYQRTLEPAIELYSGQDELALGPVLMGEIKLSSPQKIKWETGILFGLDNKTSDQSLRFMIEYEF